MYIYIYDGARARPPPEPEDSGPVPKTKVLSILRKEMPLYFSLVIFFIFTYSPYSTPL